MFNEDIVIALIISLAPTLSVIGSTIIGLKSAKKQNKILKEVHILTNDNFTKAMDKIDRLEEIIRKKESYE